MAKARKKIKINITPRQERMGGQQNFRTIPIDDLSMYNKSVAVDAYNAIHGVKRAAYGPVTDSFERIATIASIGCKKTITAIDITLIMLAVKYVRESNKHDRDNMVDICGYADLNQQLYDAGAHIGTSHEQRET